MSVQQPPKPALPPGSIEFEATDFDSARQALDELPAGVIQVKHLQPGYWESLRRLPHGEVDVPAGISIFPREMFRASRRWTEKFYPQLVHFNVLDKGGHFAAFEQPEIFVDEVRKTFATLR